MNIKIKLLTLLDVFSLYGVNLLSPIFSVFVVEKIEGANLSIVGIALGINLFVAHLLSLIMAKYFDNTKGDKDEYIYLLIGYSLISLLPILYIWANQIWHIYVLQIIGGFLVALSYPAWKGLYARSLDKGKEAFEMSFNSSANGLVQASAAIMAGFIANKFGYTYVFLIAPIIGIPGIIALFKIRKYFVKPSTS